ncbi:MAG: C-terminal binding protein [Candidatus Glassbacteria bacterium]|nr:C-terminal binding protein [Candidatus Glassbacteria bacterium]
MSKPKVVISDCDHGTVEAEKEVFEQAGLDWELLDCRREDQVIEQCAGAAGILSQYAPIKKDAIAALSGLKVLSRYGVGVDNLDLPAATAAGVAVCNVPDYCQDEVSTHAMALLLDIVRGVTALHVDVDAGGWDFRIAGSVPRTAGRTLGLIGFGAIARMTARKALGFGIKVLAFDPYVKETDLDVELTDLDSLLGASDFISLHAPLTDETTKMINAETLSRMKDGVYLVNTSRGGLVDEAALAEAAKSGKVAAAGLDVLTNEPPEHGNPLVGLKNVILTPHTSFFSDDSFVELKRKAAMSMVEVIEGREVSYCLNPDVLKG